VIPAAAEHLDQAGLLRLLAMVPDGVDVDVVQPPGHLRVGIEAVVAALDAGDIQQGEEMNALADLAGELGRLDTGPPLPPALAYFM
jgi:hypothetical protein